MPSINTRQINGVIRTSEPVWSNLERLAEASLSWFTYDTHNGKYSWVINEEGNAVASLTEADIIGAIQISGAGLTNMYNAVEIEFADTVLRDQPRYVTIDLPARLRNAYEPDNTLQMSSEFVNNQPQAAYLASVTLAQSRLDRSVTLVMDYTKINLQAGDIVDVSSDTYGWILKQFRIMRVREIEGDDGSLRLEFLMSEYDDSIYSQDISNFLVAGSSGIRAIGAIGVPGTPTVVATTFNSLPAQTVSTTVPSGIVDRMQFWAADTTAGNNFNLYGSVASTDASSFTVGNTVTFSTTELTDGDWVWKTRGMNAIGIGPFSNPSDTVGFERSQAPDVIKAGTPIYSPNGNPVIGASVICVNAGFEQFPVIPQTPYQAFFELGSSAARTFTAPVTGDYFFNVNVDTNTNGARGGRGNLMSFGFANTEPLDATGAQLEIRYSANGVALPGPVTSTGGIGTFYWTDFNLITVQTLDADIDYEAAFFYTNFTQSNPGSTANVDIGWQVSLISS